MSFHFYAKFINWGTGRLCRIDTRIYFAELRSPSDSDSCRAIAYLKNPGGVAAPLIPLPPVGHSGLIPIFASPRLVQIATLFDKAASLVSRPFLSREYVLLANLVSYVASRPAGARRLIRLHGPGYPEVVPFQIKGIWFAWGDEQWLDPYRCPVLASLSGLKRPACYVDYSTAPMKGVLGSPKIGTKVKHPLGILNAAILAVLPSIL